MCFQNIFVILSGKSKFKLNKIMKTTNHFSFFRIALIPSFLFSFSCTMYSQSWIKALGSKDGDALNQIIVLPDNNLYISGIFFGSELMSSDPAEGNLLKAKSSANNFLLKMNSSGKILQKFRYSGFFGNIVAGDKQGNFIMLGGCDSLRFPGDSFNVKSISVPKSQSIIIPVAIEFLDSNAQVKWHYLFHYIHPTDVALRPPLQGAHRDAAGNWYFLFYAHNLQIENDSMWNDKSTDSNLVLLKLDSKGKYIWHKRLQTSVETDMDANGNILQYIASDGFTSNSILYRDISGNIKWKKYFYENNGIGIKEAVFNSTGDIFVVDVPKSGSDSVYEFDSLGSLQSQDPFKTNYSAADLFLLKHSSGKSVFELSDNEQTGQCKIKYADDGIYSQEMIGYYTDQPQYSWISAYAMAATFGPNDELYFVWSLSTDTSQSQPNSLHTMYRSVQGFGSTDLVVARLSPDSIYLGMGKQAGITAKSFSVYPNPANNTISIGLPGNTMVSSLVIYDILGNPVKEFSSLNNFTKLDIAGLPSGIYMIKLNDKSGNTSYGKFIRE